MKERSGLIRWFLFLAMLSLQSFAAVPEQGGSIRGMVKDGDFEAPLGAAQVTIVELGARASTSDQGSYVLNQIRPGTYTLVFSKEGYVRQVKADVVVTAGRLTEVDVALAGEFTEMEEFIVQDLELGGQSEASLLALRFDSPALLDSIGADFLNRAGASDAAGALRLVAGATVQDDKFAVIRGLPDRYVSSQLNGVRLPSADEDTRAVELDQFPSPVIESIQVSKTFTPDQQGDASGGAVDVRLRGIPEEAFWGVKLQTSANSQVWGEDGFLTYDGGGVDLLGDDGGDRRVQSENIGGNWDGAVGVKTGNAPYDYKWSVATGGKHLLANDSVLGGFLSLFYERDSSFHDDGINDSLWVKNAGDPLTPEQRQLQGVDDFKTALFDVTEASASVQLGGLATLGLETDNHELGMTLLYTRTAVDTATLAENTRGKEFFFPGHDPDDPSTPGHEEPSAAPYLRTETLEYTERQMGSLQLYGKHGLPVESFDLGGFSFGQPVLDWNLSRSVADLHQPDKRQFGSLWTPGREPIPGFVIDPTHGPFKPAANFNLGNVQRIFKDIEEDSKQVSVNLELPFEQWSSGEQGYFKFGFFDDSVDRQFEQDTFSNFGDFSEFVGDFSEFWSAHFPFEDHPLTESLFDVDYEGEQDIRAWYGMINLPLSATLNLVTGARFESTDIGIVNDAEEFATWFPPGSSTQVMLEEGDADVDFSQDDVLPAVGLVYEPTEQVTVRASYSETVARQTFKELTPIVQQEFLGGPIFIGNPLLEMGAIKNYDLRVDWRPNEGGLLSLSGFWKELTNPIEFVQRLSTEFSYTTPVNFPEGELKGIEAEARQDLGVLWDELDGFSIGANATFIDSEVKLPDGEVAAFEALGAPITERNATNAPEHLYNLYLNYDYAESGTQASLFYTVTGDSLVAGAGEAGGNFIPDVYAKEFGTLNFSISRRLRDHITLEFKARNLTNPDIEQVYRSDHVPGGDVTRTSFQRGREFSIGISITN